MKPLKVYRDIDKLVYNQFKNQPFWTKSLNFFSDNNVKTVLDIGASSGIATLMFLELPQLEKIHCFEPDIENFSLLKENTKDYNHKVILHNFGIYYGIIESNVVGIGDNSPLGYMVEDVTKDHDFPKGTIKYKGKKFKLSTLESVIEIPVHLIKLDVEGAEYNIIENSTLLKRSKYLIISFHNHSKEYVKRFLFRNLSNFIVLLFENSGTYSDVLLELV